jgi:hypothetical protein
MAEKTVRALAGSDVGKSVTYETTTDTLSKVVHETNRSEITLGGTLPLTFPANLGGSTFEIPSEQFGTASVEIVES